MAPYADPDGRPSWQPSEDVRAMDAAHRRHRLAWNVAEAYRRLQEAEAAVLEARQRLEDMVAEQMAYAQEVAQYHNRRYRDSR